MNPLPKVAYLEARGISKSFPGVQALSDVDLDVYAGQVNVLVGENGAGKSTLMNILSGVFGPDRGRIRLAGQDVAFADARDAQRNGIAIIHQELNLIPDLSVAENIFLGREFVTPLGLISYSRMNREAARLLDQLELKIDPRTRVADLRVGDQQVVEIAKALSTRARVLIMDEPTSAISDHEVEVLFRLIGNLKAQGVAIVYITHKLGEVFRIGDRITVLRDGKQVFAGALANLDRDAVVRYMVGREMKDLFRRKSSASGKEVLRAEHICLNGGGGREKSLLDDVSLCLHRGEVVGIFGLLGAGRTELMETIFGLHPRNSAGKVFVDGSETAIRSPGDAIGAGIGLAPEDRKAEGLVLLMGVGENVSLASLNKIEKLRLLSGRLETALADRFAQRLGIKTPSLRQIVRNLSGGNQQKVILAKWLATEPKVLLLDEPTRGIDVNAKQEIYELIDDLTQTGLGVVLVSSEMPELLAMADRILVMSEGRITAEFDRGEASEEKILNAALPGTA